MDIDIDIDTIQKCSLNFVLSRILLCTKMSLSLIMTGPNLVSAYSQGVTNGI